MQEKQDLTIEGDFQAYQGILWISFWEHVGNFKKLDSFLEKCQLQKTDDTQKMEPTYKPQKKWIKLIIYSFPPVLSSPQKTNQTQPRLQNLQRTERHVLE